MATIDLREELIASRYDGLKTGPDLLYTFESQEGIPVDAGNPLPRDLSPFTLRLVVPKLVGEETDVDVNLIGRASQDSSSAISSVRSSFGISSVTGAEAGAAFGTLQQIVSAGQVVSGLTSSTERAVFTDALTAADVAMQVERLLTIPPLTLFVNPSEMTTNYSVVQQYASRSREGFLFERWGEGMPTLSFSGSTGAFMAAANPQTALPGDIETASQSGLQWGSVRDSAAYQQLMALFHFFRNNGYIYNSIEGNEAHLMIGSVAIDYDQWTYVGHIESFDYSFTESSPFRVEWSMEFHVAKMYDHAETPLVVLPMTSPQPNASYPARTGSSIINQPDSVSGGTSTVQTSGPALAEVPLNLLK